jgi:hypothetical protein
VTFCVGQPDVEYVELIVPGEKRTEERARKDGKKDADAPAAEEGGDPTYEAVKRERLLELLAGQHEGRFTKDRVAFVPMQPRDNLQRFLAIIPTEQEPVAESLELLREQAGMRTLPLRGIDSDVTILMGLARATFPCESYENTAIVRVGTEETLVILLEGDRLHHCDHLRSVTAFDSPDTVCSRVLLQQDVQGIGTVHNVLVLSEEREAQLLAGFSSFYPDARVETLRSGLVGYGVVGPGGEETVSAAMVPAVGVALQELLRKDKHTPFEPVNMLPMALRRRGRRLDLLIAWHTPVVGVLLFLVVLFFVNVYFKQQSDIEVARVKVAEYPAEVMLSGEALQARIDSLQTLHVRITTSLNTLDSLLVGSDKWSRALARTSSASVASGQVWVDRWEQRSGTLALKGFALSRDHVVQLAQRLDASIQQLSFTEVREVPIFEYLMEFDLPEELPMVADYLRERAAATVEKPPEQVGELPNLTIPAAR